MKRFSAVTFATLLSVGVSSLAFTASAANQATGLIAPPPLATQQPRYVPSAPARKTEAELAAEKQALSENVAEASDAALSEVMAQAGTAPQKPAYTPSVPARKTEAQLAAEAEAAAVAVPASAASVVNTGAVQKPAYTPSVPARKTEAQLAAEKAAAEAAVAKAAMEVQPQPQAPVAAVVAPQKTAYAPSVPARKTEAQLAAEKAEGETGMPSAMSEAPVTIRNTPVVPPAAVASTEKRAPQARTTTLAVGGLSEALAQAYNFNPELHSFRSRLKSVDEQIPQAYAGWLPTARADYGYGWEKQKSGGATLDSTHPETKSVSIIQPIFNGGETLARTSRAFNSVTVARAQLTDSEQRVLSDAVKAYMDVVRTGEILKLSINNEQVLREQLQATKDRFKLGETTRTDVAQSEARLARATSDKVKAAGDLDVAKANYFRVIGEVPKNSVMPKTLPAIPKSLEEALRIGLEKNPSLIAADVSREIADDDVDIAISSLLPEISLRASQSEQSGLSTRSGGSLDEKAVTLNASIPIFQSGAEYSRVRQGKRTRQQRKEEYEATRNQTVENITSRWRDIETARASIVSNKSTVESASVALNGVRQEADVGTRTTLDVLDAEQELFVAKVNLVTAETREVLAVYALRAAIGSLTAPELALNVEPYDPTLHERSVKYRVIGF